MLGLIGGAPRLRVSDSFTRADSAVSLGSADTGQLYVAINGTAGIISNQMYFPGDASGNLYLVDTGISDGEFEMAITGDLNGTDYRVPQIAFRALDANNMLVINLYWTGIELKKVDGGAQSNLVTGLTATLDNTAYTMKAVCKGNAIEIFQDNVSKLTHTLAGGNTKYAAYTKMGPRLLKGGAPTVDARWLSLRASS